MATQGAHEPSALMRLSWKPATGLYRDLFMQSLQLRGTHAATAGITWKRALKKNMDQYGIDLWNSCSYRWPSEIRIGLKKCLT